MVVLGGGGVLMSGVPLPRPAHVVSVNPFTRRALSDHVWNTLVPHGTPGPLQAADKDV